jgi:hypothetical protein
MIALHLHGRFQEVDWLLVLKSLKGLSCPMLQSLLRGRGHNSPSLLTAAVTD